MLNQQQLTTYINQIWDESIIPTLMEYIKIPNKSPHFDPHWQEHGFMQAATQLIVDWCQQHAIPGMKIEVLQEANRTPLIYIDIPGTQEGTILLYGHLDKQPEMQGWHADLGPFKPVLKGDKLYGRGAADDGYAAFASLLAINALHQANIPFARCVIMIEACEESGSYDLPYYVDLLTPRIGKPDLVICLDSGCGNYEQMWVTTSLRGLVSSTVSISTMTEGIHSGSGSGIVPSCFRIFNQLLQRIEDSKTGDVLIDSAKVTIPPARIDQAKQAAQVLAETLAQELPFLSNVKAESDDISELILRRTWKAALSVIGCNGMPAVADAGNVSLPTLTFKLSLRIPPTTDPANVVKQMQSVITQNPPYQAQIQFEVQDTGAGWNAPIESPWLQQAANEASIAFFGKPTMYMGEGGSIPFMGMLGKKFPQAQFLITGVLGPQSNAHGPNEFLHIPTGKKLTACIAYVIAKSVKHH